MNRQKKSIRYIFGPPFTPLPDKPECSDERRTLLCCRFEYIEQDAAGAWLATNYCGLCKNIF